VEFFFRPYFLTFLYFLSGEEEKRKGFGVVEKVLNAFPAT